MFAMDVKLRFHNPKLLLVASKGELLQSKRYGYQFEEQSQEDMKFGRSIGVIDTEDLFLALEGLQLSLEHLKKVNLRRVSNLFATYKIQGRARISLL